MIAGKAAGRGDLSAPGARMVVDVHISNPVPVVHLDRLSEAKTYS
jgi:hypothetical protein